jgi:hypothetical protein
MSFELIDLKFGRPKLVCFNCGETGDVAVRGECGVWPWFHWNCDVRGERGLAREDLDPLPTCPSCWDWLCIPF